MRIGAIVAKDDKGRLFAIGKNGAAVELEPEIGALKNAMDKATLEGLSIDIGKKPVNLVSGMLLTNHGLAMRRKFGKGK
jgi:hypothetical protein